MADIILPPSRRSVTAAINQHRRVDVGERDRRRQEHARRQFPDLPDAAHDAAQEPEPARSARHQPVHPAARAVRAGRAAAQAERRSSPRWSSLREDRAGDHGARLCRLDRRGRRRRPPRSSNGKATWSFDAPKPVDRHRHDQERDRPDRLHRQLHDQRRHAELHLGRPRQQRRASGRTATTRSRSPPRTPAASRSRSRPRSQGVVDSVDLTKSPPVLSIGGQTFTLDKIKRVVRAEFRSPQDLAPSAFRFELPLRTASTGGDSQRARRRQYKAECQRASNRSPPRASRPTAVVLRADMRGNFPN